ncbi:MAG: AAA family ATPase [archaeon]|nr:AAA family ATPase [archaeon]
MLKRKIYDEFLSWKNERKNNKIKECLTIYGARQVGKSFIVNEFGKNEYKSYIEINFVENPEYKEIFDGSLEADEIYKKMSLYIPNFNITENDTLIFLDEIQLCGNARTALKFLACDFRCDVITSGSLLGLRYGKDADGNVTKVESYPVGYERQITLHSLDFEEFVWALGYDDKVIGSLKEYYDKKEKVPASINTKWQNLFREYIVVGGMPEVVNEYALSKDFNKVHRIQEKIVDSYKEDITNHAKGSEKEKVRKCYDTIPNSLAKENKKFKYGDVINKATRRNLEDSITWLIDTNMVIKCNNIETPTIPLKYYAREDYFKLYLNDTGLLMCLYGKEAKKGIINDTLKGSGKGGIYENVIGDLLFKKGYNLLFYKPNEDKEIEFLIEYDENVIPIEVKASNNRTASLNTFISTYKPDISYKLISGNIGYADGKYTLPHYMIMFI